MSFGQIFQAFFCFGLSVVALAGGATVWLMIRGRPVTLDAVTRMIGGIVRWMIVDFVINMIFSTIFNNRRRWF